jgi:hypothetical protein
MTHKTVRRLARRIAIPLGVSLASLAVVGLSTGGISAAATLDAVALSAADNAHAPCKPKPCVTPTAVPTSTTVPAPTTVPGSTAVPTTGAVPTTTAVPTATMTMPMPTATLPPASADGALGNSAAFGIWVPTARDTCTAAEHDSFYVIGPDGLRYPTWHPPVMTRANGTTCTFGHEHGQDPRTANEWAIAQRHYAYQIPGGALDLAHAGIPFGYANQQMDGWLAATGNASMTMRHEDHVGHKVAIANSFPIGLDKGNGTGQFFYPGVTCNYVVEYHQGTHARDAFENNLHQVLYNSDCSDGHGIHLDVMGEYGKVGEFTRLCDQNGVRSTSTVITGTDFASPGFPGTTDNGGARMILDRACVEAILLVPSGQFSGNPYEAWPIKFSVTRSNGTSILDGLNLLFDVEDSIRYYYPGQPNNLGHFQDLCYENLNGDQFRGSLCETSTNFGQISGIQWDDPRAGFRDLNRGVYFKPGTTHNSGGATVWYTDPFGGNAQTTPFPGSTKQLVTADTTDYAAQSGTGTFETANVINMLHNDGGHTVHAPN